MINREIENQKKGVPGRIIARMNSITEPQIIAKLYEASQAGVEVDLIVRGICCLRPGIPGVSENIRVRSIVGRFLEHSRVFCFENGGDFRIYASSADLMDRNLHHRVETCFPVEDKKLAQRLRHEVLDLYLEDNQQSWVLTSDGHYDKQNAGDANPVRVQETLLKTLAR